MIDRIAPTRRPDGNSDGTQRWESLLFCHWEVDAQLIQARLPDGLQVDTFDGRAFLGIVPFKMRSIRPSWLPKFLAMDFYETNVRTYVICNDRPGVYFFSLDANSWLAVWAARLGWSLPYYHATMQCDESDGRVTYQSHRRGGKAAHQVSFEVKASLGASRPDTLEHFLFERYLLFVRQRGVMQVGQVHHDPYQVLTAEVLSIEDQLLAANGFTDVGGQPTLAHYSPGVDVEVFGNQSVE